MSIIQAQPEPGTAVAPEVLLVPAYKVHPIIGTGPTTVKKLIADGVLESVKVGRSRLVTMRSIRALAHAEAA